jgi:methyltransferase-like protein/SAM-dependent methyltransferase
MSEERQTSYDEVPYGSNVFHYTHPDRLAAVAALLGMHPAPADRCRVLELGCGTGANLIPMALSLPGSHFVGIDLSPRQIAMGQEVVGALGLGNIELQPLSILDVDDGFGRFDYVLCHGVYSWVPPAVQDRILSVCAHNLAPSGVAYVSYNTYPGWHIRGMIREMMGYHVRQFTEPRARVEQARAMLDFLVRAAGSRDTVYANLLKVEAELLEGASDTYVYHEHLEEVNHPLYFHQFAARATAKGLQYLAEAQPTPLPSNLSPEVVQTLEGLSADLVQGEQYLDFVRNRTFRRTLLCHAGVPLQRPPSPEALAAMHVTGLVKPVAEHPDLCSTTVEAFHTAEDTRLSTNDPVLKTALAALFESWPAGVAFGELCDRVQDRLAGAPGDGLPAPERESLARALLQCYLSHLVEVQLLPAVCVTRVSDRPRASPLARLQARGEEPITNLRHRRTEVAPFDRLVLRYLDGSRTHDQVLDGLAADVAEGALQIEHDGRPLREPALARPVLAQALPGSLDRLARSALLLG